MAAFNKVAAMRQPFPTPWSDGQNHVEQQDRARHIFYDRHATAFLGGNSRRGPRWECVNEAGGAMPHDVALIATIAVGFALAFVFGFVANRIGLPPLVGYLVAGSIGRPFNSWLCR